MKRLAVFAFSLLLSGLALADAPFNLSGRISVRQQDTPYYATLSWQHALDSDDLTLSAPTGQGVAELRRDQSGAVLQMADGKRYVAPTLDDLAGRLFGVDLPLAQLPDWMRGIAPDAQLDEQKRPVRLVLPTWTVEWLRWSEDGRPLLISLERSDASVSARLRIDTWTDSNPASGEPKP
ncbi:MAG TPA: lipoprotein insertase outer membrane protein LolB [Rhodocyclaceae bacterium]|nr:lipoprotein insertase outer membrane protein LolB [Rhodocyclaceae bacterium]